jgi:hypothetical protein
MRLGADGSKSGLWATGFVSIGNSELEIFLLELVMLSGADVTNVCVNTGGNYETF